MVDPHFYRDEELSKFIKLQTNKRSYCICCGNKKFSNWTSLFNAKFNTQKCSVCGFIFMNPFTSDRGLSFYYNNYIDKRRLSNKKKMLLREKQYELDAQFIKKYVKSGKLLDIGCSGGFFLKKLPKSFEKYGIDLDVEAINYANKNSKFKGNLIGGDFLKQKYKNNYFDVITMRGTIEHLSNPEKYLKKITKILKPGGKLFIIATPNGSSIGAKIFKKHWTLYHPIQHLSHFSMNNLELFFKKYNLNQYSYEYPYIGTPYENFFKDLLNHLYCLIKLTISNDKNIMNTPPFFGNMISACFTKD